jgi:ribosomal protein S18 acetylase RimI-like enzyme
MSFVIDRFDPAVKYAGLNQFDCGLHPVNKFVKDSLKKQVKQGLSVAYVMLEEGQDGGLDRFVGFYTVASHSVPISVFSAMQLGSLPRSIPCIRLIMLGVHADDAGNEHGRHLMNHAFDVVKRSARDIGSYGLYLDADAGAVSFYQRLGFWLLEGDKRPDPSPMFIPLAAIR